jgi:hypothetical protein
VTIASIRGHPWSAAEIAASWTVADPLTCGMDEEEEEASLTNKQKLLR